MRDRWQNKSGDAGAENDRRHNDVQPVEAAGGHEARNGLRTALDQHAAQAARRQGLEDRGRREDARRVGEGDLLDAVRDLEPGARARDHHAAHTVAGEGTGRRGKSSARIDHDADRMGPRDVTHRELRIVGPHRAGADHHRVDQGAQAMQVAKSLRAVDVA